jgi:hypothetical protein
MNDSGGAYGAEAGRRTGMDADMGERPSDGRPSDGRHVRSAAGARGFPGDSALEALLTAALRAQAGDAETEQRAVAAFRAARDAGAHGARTRRRDDWRPRERGWAGRSARAVAALLLGGLTLGGVAVAAIGSADAPDAGRGDHRSPHPSATAGVRPTTTASPSGPGASASPDRPATAQDTEAHCRAYEQVKDRGNAMDSTAWQRLVRAAGGEPNVAAYCAEQLAQADKKPDQSGDSRRSGDPGQSGDAGQSGNSGDSRQSGDAGQSGNSGDSRQSGDSGNPGKASEAPVATRTPGNEEKATKAPGKQS